MEPVVCDRVPTRFDVEVEPSATGKRIRKTIDLSDTAPGSRPRILALLVAEAARATCSDASSVVAAAASDSAGMASPPIAGEQTSSPAPNPREPPPRPPLDPSSSRTPATAAPEPPGFAFAVGGALDARAFPAYTAALLGGRVGVDATFARRIAASIDGVVLHGSTRDPLGTVDLTSYGVGATLGLQRGGPTAGRFGVRSDVWWTVASGVPERTDVAASSAGRLLVALGAEARIDVPLGDRFHGTVSLLGGAVLRGMYAQADDRTTAGVAGPMMGISVGGGWEL